MGTTQNDHNYERALAHFEKLIALRPTFLHHESILVSVDHALGKVFNPQNHNEISNYVTKIEKLVVFVQEMDKLGVSTTGIGIPLPDLHASEAKPEYGEMYAKYEKLRDARQQLTGLGIPTIDVEIATANILMVIDIHLIQMLHSANKSAKQRHGAALLRSKFLEEPTIVKKRSPSADVKSEPSKQAPRQSKGLGFPTPLYKTETASTVKRSASIGDTGDAKPEDISKDEANEAKRRKKTMWPSLEFQLRGGKECTEPWRVPVNEVATEGLRLVSKESEGSLSLYFDGEIQSIVVVFKGQCLSAKYPLLKLMPVNIHTVKRNSLKTKKDLKARLFTRDYLEKIHSFDVIFANPKDFETFLEKIRLSCSHKIASRFATGYATQSDL